jgi:hypothetical protein
MSEPRGRSGTRALIVGLALSLTGAISIAALVVQLAVYDPPCELVAWGFVGACGALRLLVALMLPFLIGGLGLVGASLVLRLRHRRPPRVTNGGSASNEREPRQKPRG